MLSLLCFTVGFVFGIIGIYRVYGKMTNLPQTDEQLVKETGGHPFAMFDRVSVSCMAIGVALIYAGIFFQISG